MLERILAAVHRARLGRAAIRFAEHGWDVVPGAVRHDDRFRCERGCPTMACHPDQESWERAVIRDPAEAARWWSDRPCAVLLATGRAFDVLEVPALLGICAARERVRGPVAVTGAGRWMFLVRPGAALRRELARRPDVVLHGTGSWIPAPPTRTLEGSVRWLVDPEEECWRLPEPRAVQASLTAALPSPQQRRLPLPQAA
jgi:Bifunctional DNA primase/polymerase, N-terminal